MATNSITGALNSRLRISGMSSGLDIDSMVEQLMSAEKAKVDKVKQSRTLLEWKRDDYRSVINSIRAFKDDFFDVLKPATNMRSASSFSAFKTTYSGAATSSYFTATAGPSAVAGNFNISSAHLAQAAKVTSSSSITGDMTGAVITIDGTTISAANDNNKISVNFNGTTKEITIDNGLASASAVADNLNQKLAAAFGTGKISVTASGGKISFSTASTNVMSIGNAYNTGYSKILGTSINGPVTLDSQSNKFTVSLNGAEPVTITLDPGTYANADALMSAVQEKINNVPELNGKVRVQNLNNSLSLKVIGGTGTATGALADAVVSDGETIDASNKTFDVTIDGVTKTVTLDEKSYTKNELLTAIQSKLNSAFGSNKAMVSMDEGTGKLRFEGISSTDKLTAARKENGGIAAIGYQDANKSNKLNTSAKLSDISGFFSMGTLTSADGDGDGYNIEFTINGKGFQFKSTQSLSEVISAVNADSDAGVTMTYDQLNDNLVVKSKTEGVTSKVQIQDAAGNGNLMSVLGLAGANAAGTDAAITYNDGSGDQTITRSSNTFTINGIEISLKKEYSSAVGDPIEVKIEGDATSTVELVKNFVSKYNELLDKINTELGEKVYRDYPPLTDEQRADMSESDIKLWEEKAKSGILRNDGMLNSFVNKMRNALYQEVEGVSKKLYSIGITTGAWDQKGKLVVDEAKLKDAVTNSPDEVINLFTSQSSIAYSPNLSATDRATRDSENGIANRLYDIMQDYVRTTRNSDGQKGILLEKAGIVGDITENNSLLSKEIASKESMIATLLDKLEDKEDRYYSQFTAMEKAISQMNNQISWMTSQTG